MNPFTIFLLVLAIVAGVLGFMKGLVRQIGSIAGIVAGIIVCRLYGHDAAAWLGRVASTPAEDSALITICAYAGLFVLAYLGCIIAASLLRKVVSSLHLGLIDRVAGAALKIFVWAMLVSLALNVWVAFAPESRPEGVWARRVENLAPAVMGIATGQMPDLPKQLNL